MKKAERKKQLHERVITGIAIAGNLVWIFLLCNVVYANYTEGNYIDYWPQLRIHNKPVVYEPEPVEVSLGEFKLTAYCPCKECCEGWADKRPVDDYGNILVIGAAGTLLEEGKSIAVDPDVIPYGTKVLINGQEYVAADCGGDIKGNWIDIYMEDHERAKEYGVKYTEVYIIYDSNTGT